MAKEIRIAQQSEKRSGRGKGHLNRNMAQVGSIDAVDDDSKAQCTGTVLAAGPQAPIHPQALQSLL